MDWYVDLSRAGAASDMRREIVGYLQRHAVSSAGIDEVALTAGELLGNVARHAPGPAWVALNWPEKHPLLTVWDLGPGFVLDPRLPDDPSAGSGRGLFLVNTMASRLEAAARRGGGMQVSAELPVERAASISLDPPRHTGHVLPNIDEATPGLGFGKESFLRALVVELAQSIEVEHGPGAAESSVAQVGTDVGGQMEAEFRTARNIVGRMTSEQMGECYVRLKHAIDGEFFVIECTKDKIVLGNTKCPFGDAVRFAPALCRMTSSVFGGIAARNSEQGASVVLEERIAVGDPGCRVVIYLDQQAPDPRVAHRYRTPSPS